MPTFPTRSSAGELRAATLAAVFASALAAACADAEPSPPPVSQVLAPSPPAPVAPRDDAAVPTFHGEIAPLLSEHCSGCHVEGGIGPFALATYADAFAHRDAIAAAVAAREMPPWLPSETCGSFRDARRLASIDIDRIVRWARGGGPEGAQTSAPLPAPRLERKLEWIDRAPDIGADFVPRVQDEWRCFLLDPTLTEDAMLVGYDVQPTARAQVHHAGFLDTDIVEARALDDASPEPGWPCNGSVEVSTGRLLGSWAAGFGAVTFPSGSGIRLPKGRGLVLQVHYHMHDPTKPIPDRTRVALQLARGSLAKEATIATMAATVGTIPPRTNGYRRSASMTLPAGGTIWAMQPHMHVLGASIRATVRGPGDVDATCLFDVPRWNYHWETMHFLETGRVVPAGAVVDLECTWNNPTPLAVTDGHGLDDEMCDLGLIVTP